MKKLYVFLIYLLVITVCLCSTINATEDKTITKDEAQDLVFKAYDFSRGCRAYHMDDPNIDWDKSIIIYPDEIKPCSVEYYRVVEDKLPGGSYAAMCENAKAIYTNDVAQYAYKYAPLYPIGTANDSRQLMQFVNSEFYINGVEKHAPLYYFDANCDLYASLRWYQVAFSFALLNANDNTETAKDSNIAIEIINGDANSATALVSYIYTSMDNIPPFDIQTVECKFVKTDNGWRIDESEFSVLASTSSKETLEAYRAAVNPSTGDENGVRIWWLAGASIAAIVPAALLVQRRRRRED